MDTQTLEQNWASYLAAYSDIADIERRQLLEQSVADDMMFTNPGGQGETRAGLIAHIENFQKTMPGTYFSTEKVFVHMTNCLPSGQCISRMAQRSQLGIILFARTMRAGLSIWLASFDEPAGILP